MENEIKTNDFVWAKIARSPPWPSVVVNPSKGVPRKPNSEMYWIYFFGSHDYAWVDIKYLKPYKIHKDRFTSLYKITAFKKAVTEIEDILAELERDPDYEWPIEPFKVKKIMSKRTSKSISGSAKKRSKLMSESNSTISVSPQQEQDSYDFGKSDITTSELTFGVLGIGIIGSRIVKNLIKTGHKVNIWNRTLQRCTEIANQLQSPEQDQLKTFVSPRSVMRYSDIVLNCVSDCDVSKKIIQNYFGINDSDDMILKKKGFVEVTSTDPETSKDISDMIEMKGGRYLEAQIQGSKVEAAEGKLVILTAGNKSLFFDCQTCFEAIGMSAYFLGDVGYATKINLILQLIKGICLVGLAEGFALAERCGVSFENLITMFEATNLSSSYLIRKANIILDENFNDVEQSLQSLQRDLYLGLQLSNKIGQPMELASIANEILKHCRRFDLSDRDASSVYLRTRF